MNRIRLLLLVIILAVCVATYARTSSKRRIAEQERNWYLGMSPDDMRVITKAYTDGESIEDLKKKFPEDKHARVEHIFGTRKRFEERKLMTLEERREYLKTASKTIGTETDEKRFQMMIKLAEMKK